MFMIVFSLEKAEYKVISPYLLQACKVGLLWTGTGWKSKKEAMAMEDRETGDYYFFNSLMSVLVLIVW